MQDLWITLLLAVVQGITEWLPISSSGHMLLVGRLVGYTPDVAFLSALHFGTLMALFVYFGEDLVSIVRALLSGSWKEGPGREGLLLGVAFIPLAVVGGVLHTFRLLETSSWILLSGGWLVTSLILSIGSYAPGRTCSFTFRSAFLIGCAQLLSLLRGISRSGSTISMGLWVGLSEREAVRFSFLLSLPVVFGAQVLHLGSASLPLSYFWGTMVAFGVGICGVHFAFTRLLIRRVYLRWFAVYTGILGMVVLLWEVLV